MVPSPSSGRAPTSKDSSTRAPLRRDFGRYAGLGFQFVAALAVFGLAGWWLDQRLGLEPWLLVLGIFLGGALGFYSLLRAIPAGGSRSPRSGPPEDGARRPPPR
ncbi:MAG: AtpZ/AtpI family protein [Planctomycetes bacterium]|nr:AtpZ/AtpI family protein [Planctomycetota bacterium]